jgi:glycosyltransferase involved in cell wall biosynthesis
MKEALVIHPQMSYYAGGELLCLYVCKALQEAGYQVTLACDVFKPLEIDRFFGLGSVVQNCKHKRIITFSAILPFLVALQRVPYAVKMRTLLCKTKADVIFSTQSSSFYIPTKKKLFHVVYNARDMFNYPLGSNLPIPTGSKAIGKPYRLLLRFVKRFLLDPYRPEPTIFFAVGSRVLQELVEKGYRNSALLFPPCRTTFRPKFPKKRQVVQFTRIIPDKRLELFLEIAQRLPEYPFYIVGRTSTDRTGTDYEYSQKILGSLPRNVTFVEALTRERPDLLEQSKVYLYTGIETGIGVALVEAISAGCIPFSPNGVGATDVIKTAGVGYLFDSAQQAAEKIREVIEAEQTREDVSEISGRSHVFSPEIFMEKIKKIVH